MPRRDPVQQFVGRLAASLADGSFVRLILSGPRAGGGAEQVLARRVDLKGTPHLSLTFHHGTRDVTKNLAVDEGVRWIHEQLGREFSNALLGTTARDWQLVMPESGRARLLVHHPATTHSPERTHDQPRGTLLDYTAQDWLHGLGVTDAAGKVRAAMADKHRQIDRYLEILSHLAKDCGWHQPEPEAPRSSASQIANRKSQIANELVLADMGCGKGYLTFGAWHLFHRVWRQPVRVIGIEVRADLVEAANRLARQIQADGLEFAAGAIQSAPLPPVDALIALHACDTATDDAIRRGIELGAKLIVVAPCCHKELRPQLGRPEPLASILRHGILEERMAEWLTDGLRALFLEWAGYRAKVFEFVSSEHTPKNLMIAAVRRTKPFADAAAKQRIEELKSFFGIKHHALDPLLVGAEVRKLTSNPEPGTESEPPPSPAPETKDELGND
jgi:SAM-dependent methyltransferase